MEPQVGESRWVLDGIVNEHLGNLAGGNMGIVVVEGTGCIGGIGSKLGRIGRQYRVVLEKMGFREEVVVVGIGIGIGLRDPWQRV
ncbi:hypothetical protein RHMOL_Rhmol07G0036600 [Rhododendron molle]|uniref:Uncharacterized protein n=1 Tax=Rhododendron molle TaxID=49168 RepID=A0ACC0MYP7_RHOML|nr:hypothetical protein RHMOL_Rhmol07G0036600 [Rhododendron molle]